MLKFTTDPKIMEDLRRAAMQIAGLPDLVRRVVNFTVSDTVDDLHVRAQGEMTRVFDRPTPYMMRGVKKIKPGTGGFRTTGDAGIFFEEFGGSTSPADVIWPHIHGGKRNFKASEKRLRGMGAGQATASLRFGAGQYLIPTKAMPRDAYGNVSGSRMSQILFELGTFDSARSDPRNDKRRKRRGTREYFVFWPKSASRPIGIAERIGDEKMRLLLVFSAGANYKKRYDLEGFGRAQIVASAPRHFARILEKEARRAGLL